MSKPLSYSFISYDDYKADKASMNSNDLAILQYYAYDAKGLNDTEQMIASLRCVIPDYEDLEKRFETLATDRGVTGRAYSESKLE